MQLRPASRPSTRPRSGPTRPPSPRPTAATPGPWLFKSLWLRKTTPRPQG
jgi:hypothetical protein